MNRRDEAKKIFAETGSIHKTAEQMGIHWQTVAYYLQGKTPPSQRRRHFSSKQVARVRTVISEELERWNLPETLFDEALEATAVYVKVRGRKVHSYRQTVRSILQLLCQHHRIPTPTKLQRSCRRFRGRRKGTSGYMDVAQVMDGLTVPEPMEYVKQFCHSFGDAKWIPRAQKAYELMGRQWSMGKNPRTLAAGLIYFVQDGDSNLSQEMIADALQVTTVSLRHRLQELETVAKERFIQ